MRRHLPSLNALRTFEAAARHGSFKLAAMELHVTQSAVSRQIRNLESQLGKPLFERGNRIVSLTEAGGAFLPTLSRALDEISVATEQNFPRFSRATRKKRLQIFVEMSAAECWLRPRLSRLRTAHPELEIELVLTDRRQNYSFDQADVVIHYGSGDWPGLHSELLMTLTEFPVCSGNVAGGERPLRRPDDLRQYTLLHEESVSLWRLWLEGAGINDIDWTAGPILNNAALCLDSAIAEDGVALGDELIAGDHLLEGRLVKPFGYHRHTDAAFYFMARPELLEYEEVAVFRSWLLTEVAVFMHACRRLREGRPYPQDLFVG